ncbi:MAG TPA: type II toxin-antitoxin system RelE/ParE family toxin [Caulobacteraceae bacterium]|nr:type II toxin-antitoxin system RelE/ParE family toxin [Caulobacteraceae bacterium]
MIEVRQTSDFAEWLATLRDIRARARIADRLLRAALGNLGDSVSVGEGVIELRIHFGPGYRLYAVRRGEALIVLLCGGDKSSQERDIKRAKALAGEL